MVMKLYIELANLAIIPLDLLVYDIPSLKLRNISHTLMWHYHSVLLSRLAFCAFILLLARVVQLRTPMAVLTASFSSASSERLSNKLIRIAIASLCSIDLPAQISR